MASAPEPAVVDLDEIVESPALEVHGLTKHYTVGRLGRGRTVHALNNIDLSLEKGEVLGLVGESGSGKTTFIRTVLLLDQPTAGTIQVNGQEPVPGRPSSRRVREHRRQVQMIFQDPYSSLDPLHTVRYSVGRPLRAFGIVPRHEQKAAIEELLAQVGLVPAGDFLRRYPYQLSGGQRQRVGVARALAARPSVLLADEPTSMLDVSIRLSIMNLLLELRESESLSLVFVTHDLAGAYYMSDRIAIMYAGHLLEVGPASEVMGDPRHPYTQLLREAAPDPEGDFGRDTRFEAQGDPPDLAALPPGCPFVPRCPFARSECEIALPEWRELGAGHRVRCVLYGAAGSTGGEPAVDELLTPVDARAGARGQLLLVPRPDREAGDGRARVMRRSGRAVTGLPTAVPSTAPRKQPPSLDVVTIAPYRDPSAAVAERVADLLGRMTVEEKLGQMIQIDRRYLGEAEHIARFHLGSVLSGGGSAPEPNTPAAWADMVDRFQHVALSTRLGIPLLYGTDGVHGHNNLYGATIFPHNIGLGAADDPELVRRIGEAIAVEIRATGPRWTFAPCLAVARNERWGRTYESGGEHPRLAETLARFVNGLQGDELTPQSVLATAKHFLADGGTTGGVDRGDNDLPEPELRAIHLRPYVDAVAAGVGSVMASYSSWSGTPSHVNAYLLDEVLKGELGFEGFVVSDWLGINLLDDGPGFSSASVVSAVRAGIDMIMVPNDYGGMLESLIDAVEAGAIPLERIDDAVARILRKKFELGLFENPFTDRSLAPEINSPAHRALARRAVQASIVLLKNEQDILPLAREGLKILVAGKNADDVGHQCGGWTLTWQGGSGTTVPGTSILAGIREVVGSSAIVDFAPDGAGAEDHDVAIVVLGETPYAEFSGDRPAPDDLSLDEDDLAVSERLALSGVPTVAVLVAGRPLVITDQLEHWSALVAAWLPGSEGGGVADVLFGEAAPSGRLPHSWPRSAEQVPINVGDVEYEPLFPFGFGLTYRRASPGCLPDEQVP